MGEIELDEANGAIILSNFATQERKKIYPESKPINSRLQGHGGADWHLISTFINAVATNDPSQIISGPDETLESHLIVFASEKSRKTGQVVHI